MEYSERNRLVGSRDRLEGRRDRLETRKIREGVGLQRSRLPRGRPDVALGFPPRRGSPHS